MRPYVFGIALLVVWILIAAGAIANLAGVSGVGNSPMALVPLDAPVAGLSLDASVPLAGTESAPVQRGAL